MKTYLCTVCGFIYVEDAGMPDDGIAPGTPWAAIAQHWQCPDCGAAKPTFEIVDLD